MINPILNIIMPVYNCGSFLNESIQSIINQTFRNWHLYIINDASTDEKTINILDSICHKQITILNNSKNLGIEETLNISIHNLYRNCNFLAIMHGDDIALIEKFEKQIDFLSRNPDISCCSTNILGFFEKKTLFKSKHPNEHLDIREYFLYGNPIAHPTVVFNLKNIDINDLYYRKGFYASEDYELWSRLINKYKFHILNEVLLKYRIHNQSLTHLYRIQQKESESSIRKQIWKNYFNHTLYFDSSIEALIDNRLKIFSLIKNKHQFRNLLIKEIRILTYRKNINKLKFLQLIIKYNLYNFKEIFKHMVRK